MAKSLKEMFGGAVPLPMVHISKRQTNKISTQNGNSEDEARFIEKQIGNEPPMDKTGNATQNVDAATHAVHSNTLKGKNPEVSPDGVYESLRLLATHESPKGHKAKVYKDTEWDEHRVKFYDPNGNHLSKADYHTDDKEDAHDTAKAELKRMCEENIVTDEMLDRIYEGEEYAEEFIEMINEEKERQFTEKDHNRLIKDYARLSDNHQSMANDHRANCVGCSKFTTMHHLHSKIASKHDELSNEYALLSSLHQEMLNDMNRGKK